MKVTDIFKPPFRADGAFIYSADGVMCLMAANCRYYPREMMNRIVQLINGESKRYTQPVNGRGRKEAG